MYVERTWIESKFTEEETRFEKAESAIAVPYGRENGFPSNYFIEERIPSVCRSKLASFIIFVWTIK